MATKLDLLPQRRAIIDRRAVVEQLALLHPDSSDSSALRQAATGVLREALDAGRAEIERRLAAAPTRGSETAAAYAFLTDSSCVSSSTSRSSGFIRSTIPRLPKG